MNQLGGPGSPTCKTENVFWRQYSSWATVLFNFSNLPGEVPYLALEYYHVKQGAADIFPTARNLFSPNYSITW